MPKIDIETLKFILQRNEPDIRKINAVMQEIEMELKAEEEEKLNRPPPIKKQFSIILSDADGSLAEKDIVGWVVQIPEDDSVSIAPSKIISAAYEFNTTPKGRRMPVETIGEACEVVTAKLLKEQNIWIKTKAPVLAVPVPNKIPMEKVE
ncbi:MAG: hypothetical protein NWT02_01400 [Opitutales bacterium]|jgi:hypothetical protein|nr:hypothetical protein [Opitutales bacterium]MDP4644736.1 hypothetical protein [Opitutales bacterium]MDP4694039.1 hypothetical protein [Opitutales bacterium]MDP4777326.1 hypothetical protein [Opitutales bacterium]MDP4878960.1 hypothetical protein [Opitutales bacterium]